jgi:hypothetical protein
MEESVKASGVDVGDGGGEVRVGVGGLTGGRGRAVFVGITLCVSASVVLTVEMAVSMISASPIVGVGWPLPQEASMIAARNKMTRVFPTMFIFNSL